MEKINLTLESLSNTKHTYQSKSTTDINVEFPIKNNSDLESVEDKLKNKTICMIKLVSSNNNYFQIVFKTQF